MIKLKIVKIMVEYLFERDELKDNDREFRVRIYI